MSEPTVAAIPAKTVIACMYTSGEVLAILEAHMLAAAGIPPDTKRAESPYSSVPGAAPTPHGSLRVTLEGVWPQPQIEGEWPQRGPAVHTARAVLHHCYGPNGFDTKMVRQVAEIIRSAK